MPLFAPFEYRYYNSIRNIDGRRESVRQAIYAKLLDGFKRHPANHNRRTVVCTFDVLWQRELSPYIQAQGLSERQEVAVAEDVVDTFCDLYRGEGNWIALLTSLMKGRVHTINSMVPEPEGTSEPVGDITDEQLENLRELLKGVL
jgi:hypothetical protein